MFGIRNWQKPEASHRSVDDLGFLRRAHGFLVGLAGLDDQACRVVRAHGAGAVRDPRGLQRARVPGGDGLSLERRDAMMLARASDRHGAVADRPSQLGALGDLAQDALRALRVAELHSDGVEADLVTQAVEVGDVLPARDAAVRTEQGERLELERRRLVVPLGVVDHVAALDDAAGHAVVHAAAALVEALDDTHAVQGLDVGRAALDPILVRERVEHVRLGDDRARSPLREGLLRGAFEVGPGVLLAERVELLRALRLAHRALLRVDGDVLEPLAAHDCAQATASSVPCRVAILLVVGARDGCALEAHLAGRSDRDERGGLGVDLREVLDERVVPLAAVRVGVDESHGVRGDLEGLPALRVGRSSLHHDSAVAELHQVLARIAADVGFLDAVRERALGADREPSRSGRGGAGQHARREHEYVVLAEWVALRIALLEQDACRQRPAPEKLPLVGIRLDADAAVAHVDSDQTVAARATHRLPPWDASRHESTACRGGQDLHAIARLDRCVHATSIERVPVDEQAHEAAQVAVGVEHQLAKTRVLRLDRFDASPHRDGVDLDEAATARRASVARGDLDLGHRGASPPISIPPAAMRAGAARCPRATP
jgi:hypothetical protein